jgi:hypothetical protein
LDAEIVSRRQVVTLQAQDGRIGFAAWSQSRESAVDGQGRG